MVETDPASKIRVALFFGVILFFLGGFSAAGVAQRLTQTPAEELNREILLQTRAEVRAARTLRTSLVALGKQKNWDEAVTATDTYLREHQNGIIRRLRAEALFRSGHTEEAYAAWATLLPRDEPISGAAQLLLNGDFNAYRNHCTQALERAGSAPLTPSDANNTAWMCALAENAVTDYDKPLQLAENAVADAEKRDRATFLNTLGALLYRDGQDKEAIARLTEGEKLRSDAFNWPFLALAYHRSGNPQKANYWRNRLHQRLDNTFATVEQQNSRHELLMFSKEMDRGLSAPVFQAFSTR
jgi:tetratricopeptide (TPR) repeat protein